MPGKRVRFGELLGDPANVARYGDVHVFIGGTGAVGGSALLKMLELYEEMFSCNRPAAAQVPVLVATGHEQEIRAGFRARLYDFLKARHGTPTPGRNVRSGVLTNSGIFVAIEAFNLDVLGEIRRFGEVPRDERRAVLEGYLRTLGLDLESPPDKIVRALNDAVGSIRPLSRFLDDYAKAHYADRPSFRYRSVTLAIPLPSFMAYQMKGLGVAADLLGLGKEGLDPTKEAFQTAVCEDLRTIRARLADEVIVAHTTGVGGMYDRPRVGEGAPRLGFAHSAQDAVLVEKWTRAAEMNPLYAEAGVKSLITAAAIGIDEVKIDEPIELNASVCGALRAHPTELFVGARGSVRNAKADMKKPVVHVSMPAETGLDAPGAGDLSFPRPSDGRNDVRPPFQLRSGENGYLSVANADALYRTMRVASMSELGLLVARIGLFGDDPHAPWFDEHGRCYYTETDNSRQVLDFLAQPTMRRTQLSGLQPIAFVDLGSSKHQGELHTLALLILLHRLRTLDLDALPEYGVVAESRRSRQPGSPEKRSRPLDFELTSRFHAQGFFEEHSRTLTFEDLDSWDVRRTSEDLTILASAQKPEDLIPLARFRPAVEGLFPGKEKARLEVLRHVLRAVWTIPSLGSPLVYRRDGRDFLRTGYHVAPLALLVEREDSVDAWFRAGYDEYRAAAANPCSFAEFRDHHFAVDGFIDLRPHAILTVTWKARDLTPGSVRHFELDEEFLRGVAGVKSYAFFGTCGLLAVLVRLRAFYRYFTRAMLKLGTLQDARWQIPRDQNGHMVVVPGIVESMRMVAEGLEKVTGSEFLDGAWGYGARPVPDRRSEITLP